MATLLAPTSHLEIAKQNLAEVGYCILANALTEGQRAELVERLTEQAAIEKREGLAFEDGGLASTVGRFSGPSGPRPPRAIPRRKRRRQSACLDARQQRPVFCRPSPPRSRALARTVGYRKRVPAVEPRRQHRSSGRSRNAASYGSMVDARASGPGVGPVAGGKSHPHSILRGSRIVASIDRARRLRKRALDALRYFGRERRHAARARQPSERSPAYARGRQTRRRCFSPRARGFGVDY